MKEKIILDNDKWRKGEECEAHSATKEGTKHREKNRVEENKRG